MLSSQIKHRMQQPMPRVIALQRPEHLRQCLCQLGWRMAWVRASRHSPDCLWGQDCPWQRGCRMASMEAWTCSPGCPWVLDFPWVLGYCCSVWILRLVATSTVEEAAVQHCWEQLVPLVSAVPVEHWEQVVPLVQVAQMGLQELELPKTRMLRWVQTVSWDAVPLQGHLLLQLEPEHPRLQSVVPKVVLSQLEPILHSKPLVQLERLAQRLPEVSRSSRKLPFQCLMVSPQGRMHQGLVLNRPSLHLARLFAESSRQRLVPSPCALSPLSLWVRQRACALLHILTTVRCSSVPLAWTQREQKVQEQSAVVL